MKVANEILSTEGIHSRLNADLGLFRLAFGLLLQALRDVVIPNLGEKEWPLCREDAIE